MKERFESRRLTGEVKVACKFDDGTVRYWSDRKESIVQKIVQLVNLYAGQGYKLTLRQLHYQMVTRFAEYVNHDSAYKKLGNILDDCRYAGMIDWDAIEDRGRVPFIPYSADGIADALGDIHYSYRIDRMQGQQNYIELWTEKDALSGILKGVTSKYHIQLVVNKGYTSSSAIYGSYKRIAQRISSGQKAVILYFGDHDPSGLDMIRDIHDRLMLFLSRGKSLTYLKRQLEEWWSESGYEYTDLDVERKLLEDLYSDNDERCEKAKEICDGAKLKMYIEEKELFKVVGIGLTKAQINQHKLPPNPTKMTDSRANNYVKKHGRICWEVDALNPETLTSIVDKEISSRIDHDQFEKIAEREISEKDELKMLIDKYSNTGEE